MQHKGIARTVAAKLRKLYWKTALCFRETVTVSTMQGTFTVSCSDQVIGKDLYCRRDFEADLMVRAIDALRQAGQLPPDGSGTVVDIGANIGPIAIGLLTLGLFDKAIAIEPDPGNFRLLRINVEQNGLQDRVICLPCAVSDKPGTVAFERSPTNSGDHRIRTNALEDENDGRHGEAQREIIEVAARPLDIVLGDLPAAFTDDVRLVWIDVQGHEYQAFRGAERVLAGGVPVMAEIWPYGIQRSGIAAAEFCRMASQVWDEAWIEHEGRFDRRPVAELASLFQHHDPRGRYFENVIFTSDAAEIVQAQRIRAA